MFQGLDHVSRAVRILVGRNAMLNQRLYEAAREFSLALQRPDQWPRDLLEKARSVENKLTARGRIDKTINAMDVSVAGEIAQEMYSLAMAVNFAHAARRKGGHVRMPTKGAEGRRRLDVSGALH